jgi:hypothetical protein
MNFNEADFLNESGENREKQSRRLVNIKFVVTMTVY